MNKKYVIAAAVAAGVAVAGCGWYIMKYSQRKAAELQEQLHTAIRFAQESKLDDGVTLLQSTIEEMKEFYGPENPTTIHTVAILADLLHRQNNLPDAEALMRACCVGLDKALGEEHEESLGCHSELMQILAQAGKTSEALATGTRLFDILCKKLGPNHVQCVKVGASLCEFMKAEGGLQHSVDLARIMVESCRSGSPSAASCPESLLLSLQLLTSLLRDCGDIEDAIITAQEAVAVTTANNLEADGAPQSHYTLLNLQLAVRVEDALLTARSTANYCEQLHGAQSHQHAEAQLVLARLLCQCGGFQEAHAIWERVFVVLAQTLGPDHPDILDMQVMRASAAPPPPTHTHTHTHTTPPAAGANGVLLAADGPPRGGRAAASTRCRHARRAARRQAVHHLSAGCPLLVNVRRGALCVPPSLISRQSESCGPS
jgi:tetratricopeptide (TPR) repeat protein